MAREAEQLTDFDDDCPTLVASFDMAAYARATATWEDDGVVGPSSGVRRSFPTLTAEIGALPNEPEEDAILRSLGGGARVLGRLVTAEELAFYNLDPEHHAVLARCYGEARIDVAVATCGLPRRAALRAIEELMLLAVLG